MRSTKNPSTQGGPHEHPDLKTVLESPIHHDLLKNSEAYIRRPFVPVLAFGNGPTLLGVLRCLAAARIPAFVASHTVPCLHWSRWYRRAPGGANPSGNSAELAEALRLLPFPKAVLLPCSDATAVPVASLPRELYERFPTCCSPGCVQAMLSDKISFAGELRRLDIPHPPTIEVISPAVIEGLSEEELAGFFLKPANSMILMRKYGLKAFRFRDKRHALELYNRMVTDGVAAILQEYIPGLPSDHYFIDGFVDRHGRVKARFARRRLRMHPPDFGNSSCMVSVPLRKVQGAVASADSLLAGIGYRGIFSAEFKQDSRDGQFKLIEVNARPWLFIDFTRLCGVNVSAMAYWDALGEDVPEITSYSLGRYCIYPKFDVRAGLEEIRLGRLTWRAWASSWRRASTPVFSWTDPGPALRQFLEFIPRAFKKLTSGFRR